MLKFIEIEIMDFNLSIRFHITLLQLASNFNRIGENAFIIGMALIETVAYKENTENSTSKILHKLCQHSKCVVCLEKLNRLSVKISKLL